MRLPNNTLFGLLAHVAKNPNKAITSKSSLTPALDQMNQLHGASGFAGVHKNVSDDRYSGSGLNLKLALSSGQSIELDIQKTLGGGIRNVDLNIKGDGELSQQDQDKLQQFLGKLGDAIDVLFSGNGASQDLFDFTNMSGIKDMEFTVQQDMGNTKQRLEFEKSNNPLGRKEVEAQWLRYDHTTGMKEQHNLALSKQAREVSSAYGQMDYQWVIDQITAGMGVLGNTNTGETAIQSRVTQFFASSVQALFQETKKGHDLLQDLGASPQHSKKMVGRAINALASKSASNLYDESTASNNMPGKTVETGSQNTDQSRVNALPDFKAHFASKREGNGNAHASGSYNLSMEISQQTHTMQGATKDDSTQSQFRRLLLEYESQGNKQQYEYNWMHDESVINRYKNGSLEHAYSRVSDLQQGILTNAEGVRNETSNYLSRTKYSAADKNTPALKNYYIAPTSYTERGNNVNYSA
jgi:hypothetical protein